MAMRISCSASCQLASSRVHASYQLALHGLLLLAGYGRSPGDIRVLTRVALTDARSFAAEVAQIIEFCAPHASLFHHVDVIDYGSVQRKDSFDTDAETGLAHGNRFAHAAVLARNADTFKSL